MKKTRKNRKGFTLVEMLLSLAIICMIGGVIGGLCVSIANSFATTYNIDDSADYAMLYAKGFENSFLACTQGAGVKTNVWTWEVTNTKGISGPPLLQVTKPGTGTENVFTPRFIGTSSTPSKWRVIMFFCVEEKSNTTKSALIKYRIYMRDNYSNTSYIYRYDGSFWVPRFYERADLAGVKDSRKIEVDTHSNGMTEATMKDFCKDGGTINMKAYNAIKGDLQGITPPGGGSATPVTYYTKIKYTWG